MRIRPEEKGRVDRFKRNLQLEVFMARLNSLLQCAEDQLLENQLLLGADYPVVFVMGPLRSGTTLFMQWLANTGILAYPTNLLSRFYAAPVVGAQIQLLLTDPRYNFRNEILDFNSAISFESENGKTRGALAPNEFWYFWRRFLAEPERDVWTDDELRQSMNTRTMQAELAGVMDVFQKPFAAKAMLFNYNIPFLDSIMDKVIFVQIKRDPVANVASVLEARRQQLGSENAWYSFKIPEYEQLKCLDPVLQAAGQVYYIDQAVTKGLAKVDETRKLVVQYEDFCVNPGKIFKAVTEKIGMVDCQYGGLEQFRATRSQDIENRAAIEKSVKLFESQ